MSTCIEPTPSIMARTPVTDDGHDGHDGHDGLAFLSLATAHLAALERGGISLSAPRRRRCAHCTRTGNTTSGALWRVSLAPHADDLYYLHSACLAPYKAAHGLRSVEGRLPLTHRRPRLHRAVPIGLAARIAAGSAAL